MFKRVSHSGIIMENLRGLVISLVTSSVILPVIFSELAVIFIGAVAGAYYGFRIEKQTHELSTLGGRVVRCKSWDYLMIS